MLEIVGVVTPTPFGGEDAAVAELATEVVGEHPLESVAAASWDEKKRHDWCGHVHNVHVLVHVHVHVHVHPIRAAVQLYEASSARDNLSMDWTELNSSGGIHKCTLLFSINQCRINIVPRRCNLRLSLISSCHVAHPIFRRCPNSLSLQSRPISRRCPPLNRRQIPASRAPAFAVGYLRAGGEVKLMC